MTAEAVPADASADAAASPTGRRARRRLSSAGRWEPEEEASIRAMVSELGTVKAGKNGKPDRLTVSAKNWG